ncbi:MAG: hypothetical protein ABSD96_13760 [Candidatus Korobacteraceae bacterium]|jgi:hypothetical protein
MRRGLFLFGFLLVAVNLMPAQSRPFKGTVIKMQMSECTIPHRLISNLSGTPVIATVPCAEYTVISDKVVYIIVGHRHEQSISLAEDIFFQEKNNELVVFSDDVKSRIQFPIKQMTLRSDWDREKADPEVANRAGIKQLAQSKTREPELMPGE